MANQSIVNQINKLIEKTKQKKINWEIINPDFYRWSHVEGSNLFNTTLQRQFYLSGNPPNKRTARFFLTIQIVSPAEVLLDVNSSTNSEAKYSLEDLYNTITSVSQEIKMDKLDKFIDKI